MSFAVFAAAGNPPVQPTRAGTGTFDRYLLFENSDFEMGDLTNWTATGNAFDFQPTRGDNPTARKRMQPSKHQGEFWVGTYEKYQGAAGQRPGQTQGDRPTGTLTSIPFEVVGDSITFLVGGNNSQESGYVALVVEGKEVLKGNGKRSETMERHVWDVSAYKGKTAQIVINDQSSMSWGHINADDFRYDSPVRPTASGAREELKIAGPGPLFENSDFEMGDLTNWTATGNAFDFQPTKGDNPTARKRMQPSKHQGEFWVGTYEKYQGEAGQRPGQTQGDRPTGTLTSIPFEVVGDRITFLAGGNNNQESEYVALVVEGKEVLKGSGKRSETMERHVWDVSAYKGKTAQIVISDHSSMSWGHINADDFRFE